MKKNHKVLIYRILFFFLFATTSVGKLLNVAGFTDVLSTYQLFPGWSLGVVAWGLTLFELYLAIEIILARRLLWVAACTVLLHVGYVLIALVSNLRDIHIPNCGCFGVFWARPMSWTTVFEDLIMLVISIGFYSAVRHRTVK